LKEKKMDFNVETIVFVVYKFRFNIEFLPRGIIRYEYGKRDETSFVSVIQPENPHNDMYNSEKFVIQIVEVDKSNTILREYHDGIQSIPNDIKSKKVVDIIELRHTFETSTTGNSCSKKSILKITV
jgi:hypothetical protein